MSNATSGAFPFPHYTRPDGDIHWGEQGLTKRELFAMAAMQGLISSYAFHGPLYQQHPLAAAEFAVEAADALLMQLAKSR